MNTQKCLRYLICDDEEKRFFRQGEYYTENVLNATRFADEADARMALRFLTDFQKDFLTEIVPVQFTMERIGEF